MTTLVRIAQIETLQGQTTVLHDVDWQQFEAILEDIGEKRASRIAYFDGVLEVRMPLPEHERVKEIISDLVKALLDFMEIDFEPFGSTTFKRRDRIAGFEPDGCFYIANVLVMRGVKRMDLTILPPPDLAIEVDLTSRTQFDAYRAIAVPELWIYADNCLKIYVLQDGGYLESGLSKVFGDLPIAVVIPQFVDYIFEKGRRIALREFHEWMGQNVGR